MLKTKKIVSMTIGSLYSLIQSCKIILGDEVLSYFDCEYDEIRQRNYRRSHGWVSSLMNNLISWGFIGGNYIVYEREDGSIIVVDARSRLRGIASVLSGSVDINTDKIEDGSRPWYVKAGCSNITQFSALPQWAKDNVLNAPVQVIWLNHKDTSYDEAREIFCAVNYGVQKVSRTESYDNRFRGDMTQLIGEFTTHHWLTQETGIFSESDLKNRKANDTVAFLFAQEQTSHIQGRKGIEQMYSAFKTMNQAEITTARAQMEKTIERLSKVIDIDSCANMKRHGFLLPLAWVLKNIEDVGIDLDSKVKRIRKALIEFSDEIRNYEGSNELDRKLTAAGKVRQFNWKSNGHDIDGQAVKTKRAKILRDDVLKSCFSESERALFKADIS